MSGHGGDDFLKFQGVETMMSHDLSDAVAQMHAKQRYGRLTLIIDTCQASSLFASIRSPNVVSIASSKTGVQHKDAVRMPSATSFIISLQAQ
jgi:phosphatidylinositol glycan class K